MHVIGLGDYVCDESGCYDNGSGGGLYPSMGDPTLGLNTPITNPNSSTTLNYPGIVPATNPNYGGSGSPITPNSSSGTGSSSPTNIWGAITAALQGASKTLATRYAVPQLNPGQVISTNAQGSTMYQLAPGQTGLPTGLNLNSLSGSLGSLGGILPIILIGGIIFMAAGSHK